MPFHLLLLLLLATSSHGLPWHAPAGTSSNDAIIGGEPIGLQIGSELIGLPVQRTSNVTCQENVFFPSKESCGEYYYCSDSIGSGMQIYHFTCPKGTLFDDHFDTCNSHARITTTRACLTQKLEDDEDDEDDDYVALKIPYSIPALGRTKRSSPSEENHIQSVEDIAEKAKDACYLIYHVDNYVNHIRSLIPLELPEYAVENLTLYTDILDEYNDHLLAAQNHTYIWRHGDDILSGIKRTYELAKIFSPEFHRKFKVMETQIARANEVNYNRVAFLELEIPKLMVTKNKTEIGLEQPGLPDFIIQLLNTTVIEMEKQIQTFEQELTELRTQISTHIHDLEEMVTFMEFVRTDAGHIKTEASVIRSQLKTFKGHTLQDGKSFQLSFDRARDSTSLLKTEKNETEEDTKEISNKRKRLIIDMELKMKENKNFIVEKLQLQGRLQNFWTHSNITRQIAKVKLDESKEAYKISESILNQLDTDKSSCKVQLEESKGKLRLAEDSLKRNVESKRKTSEKLKEAYKAIDAYDGRNFWKKLFGLGDKTDYNDAKRFVDGLERNVINFERKITTARSDIHEHSLAITTATAKINEYDINRGSLVAAETDTKGKRTVADNEYNNLVSLTGTKLLSLKQNYSSAKVLYETNNAEILELINEIRKQEAKLRKMKKDRMQLFTVDVYLDTVVVESQMVLDLVDEAINGLEVLENTFDNININLEFLIKLAIDSKGTIESIQGNKSQENEQEHENNLEKAKQKTKSIAELNYLKLNQMKKYWDESHADIISLAQCIHEDFYQMLINESMISITTTTTEVSINNTAIFESQINTTAEVPLNSIGIVELQINITAEVSLNSNAIVEPQINAEVPLNSNAIVEPEIDITAQ